MEFETLPNDNDVIVIGTGMTESIVSAALSRIEFNVLNIDKNIFYGGSWGSFNLHGIKECLKSQNDAPKFEIVVPNDLGPKEKFIPFASQRNLIKNIHEYDFPSRPKVNPVDDPSLLVEMMPELKIATNCGVVGECEEVSKEELITKKEKDYKTYDDLYDEMMERQRYFVLDLLPKMMYSKGTMIELLISSDVARYCEFQLVKRILTVIDNKFEVVPSSRSEVFSTTSVNVIDKRMLMKFLTFALEYEKHEDEFKEHESKTFTEFLKERKLSSILQHFIQHSIAMVPHDASLIEGLKNTKKYLSSLGRWGNSAFLSPTYGTGELLQCFCRLSAVFGGVYCLRRPLAGVIVDGDMVVGVLDLNGQRVNTKWLILEQSYAPQFVSENDLKTSSISRAMLITDKSVHPDKESHMISLANIPSSLNGQSNIIMQELPPSSGVCPKHFYVVHLTCQGVDAKSDLSHFVEQHFHSPCSSNYEMSESKPNIIWMVYFNIESYNHTKTSFKNLILVPGPDNQLDCDFSIATAESIFRHICPDLDFLPRAPTPDEIVFASQVVEEVVDEMKADDIVAMDSE